MYLCSRFSEVPKVGTLPERLGIGLQNRGRRFESARYLTTRRTAQTVLLFCLAPQPPEGGVAVQMRETQPEAGSRKRRVSTGGEDIFETRQCTRLYKRVK